MSRLTWGGAGNGVEAFKREKGCGGRLHNGRKEKQKSLKGGELKKLGGEKKRGNKIQGKYKDATQSKGGEKEIQFRGS